ncbi:hypothetical protein [Candidatus Venteria ishoeyi]|uniref:Lipoprotein n=1 Tax=Candidatus Venteria ishoeyi TaxID=1899563 RepID=A0A1H6F6C6_9GAMM|nr:hypothetical protein [Candidatus Venteria ishoeyi]MDM8547512.1 hypothetical protein [Candidatus Venteria ishoeyi]SEH05662.1 Uncharacterised protein [Candidatus Venteria ishoeyi]
MKKLNNIVRHALFLLLLGMTACSSDGFKPLPVFMPLSQTAHPGRIIPKPDAKAIISAETPSIWLEDLEILLHRAYPLQVNVIAKGYINRNCETVTALTHFYQQDHFQVEVFSTPLQATKPCQAAHEYFELIIPLETRNLAAGIYQVEVNELSTEFELPVDNFIDKAAN